MKSMQYWEKGEQEKKSLNVGVFLPERDLAEDTVVALIQYV